MFLNCCQITDVESFSLKDYAPFISSLVIIFIFIYDRRTAFILRKKELDRTWYYKVLLEPNLKKIDIFFNDIKDNVKVSLTELDPISFETNRQFYIKIQLLEIEKIKNIIRLFDLDVLQPICQKHPSIQNKISLIIENINDKTVDEIGKSFLRNYDEEKFLKSIYNDKVSLLNLLYEPLK